MRLSLIIVILLCGLPGAAQKYSKAVNDTAIINFMSWLLRNDTSNIVKHIDNDILQTQPENFVYPDSSALHSNSSPQNIFSKHNNLIAFFKREDAEYFKKQITAQRKKKWDLKLKKIKLFNTIQLNKNNSLEKFLFSYSLPIFSQNHRYVIIIEGFFCGLVCGGGEYNLFERQSDKTWKKIKTFNGWAE
jgi:hypothetical protein